MDEELGPIGHEPVLVRGEVVLEGVVHGRADDGRLARADLGELSASRPDLQSLTNVAMRICTSTGRRSS